MKRQSELSSSRASRSELDETGSENESGRQRGDSNLVDYEDSSESEAGSTPLSRSKRRRTEYNEIEDLRSQVNVLAALVTQSSAPRSSTSTAVDQSFLSRPAIATKVLDLGNFKTDVDEHKRLRPAKEHRLEILKDLQRFDSVEWKDVRYANALKNFSASPGFTDLAINEELCHFEKTRDPQRPTDRVLGGLCNAVFEQKELLKESLQGIVNWAFKNPSELTSETLFEKFTQAFG